VLAAPNQHEYSFGGELSQILFNGSAEGLMKLLVVPIRPPVVESQRGWTAQNRSRHDGREERAKLCLYDLPTEIHHLIFTQLRTPEINSPPSPIPPTRWSPPDSDDGYDEADEMLDVFNLALTCRHFWHVGRTHLEDYYMSQLGRWAGENIVAVGWFRPDETGDNPPGLFSKKQEEKFVRNKRREVMPWNLNHFVYHHGDNELVDVHEILPDTLTKPLLESRDVHAMMPVDMLQVYRTVLPRTANFYGGSDEKWILRNLTTKEFVRAEEVALKPDYVNGPEIKYLGFGEVVLSHICWSHMADPKVPQDPTIHRGTWAGHKFDITTVTRHQSETKEQEWTDISEETVGYIHSLWEKKYGQDWRDIACNPKEKKRRLFTDLIIG
jgi:hypothetical protein